jgi:cell division protein FtsB|tara:strand:+ start:266 stop:829 length:564 start_codon:yes stop_codon:yes gene_type:complete
MQINLRKANAVQSHIQEAISGIESTFSVELNEFQDPVSVIQNANNEVFENDTRKFKLLQAFYNIRALVATANASCGISTNLAKAAFADRRISMLTTIAGQKPVMDMEVIKGRLDKIKNRKDDDSYSYRDSISTSIIGKEQIAQAKAEIKKLKKEKQKINDENLDLNVKTEIPLSEETVKVLTEEGIL